MSHNHKKLISRIAIATFVGIVVSAAAPTLTGAVSAQTVSSSSNSGAKTAPGQPTFGQSGPAVVALQKAIMNNGFTLKGGATGKFDARTRTVLRTFQKVVGLKVTGVVDRDTARVLKLNASSGEQAQTVSMPAAAPATSGPFVKKLPKRGQGSKDVVIVQNALIASGTPVAGGADGIYGKSTTRAIRAFQKARGLTVTGNLDQQTAIALGVMAAPVTVAVAAPSSTTAPSATSGQFVAKLPVRGQRGNDVLIVQSALIAAGITVKGGADGIFGGATTEAISAYQKSQGFTATGRLDERTAIRLGVMAPPSVQLSVFPVQGPCSFSNTWQAPRGTRKHEGVDIIANEGNLIYAVTDGTITVKYEASRHARSGNGLRLTTSDGTYFVYAHLQRFADGIEVGTQVKAGQVIGYNGKTGNTSTPHLHFEIHPRGGAAIDPTPAVAAINGCHITTPLPAP